MLWCNSCRRNCPSSHDEGFLCCAICGKVVKEDHFSAEPVFVKNAAGQSQLSGNFVKTVRSDYSISRDRILSKAQFDLTQMAEAMKMGYIERIVRHSMGFYTIAVERNFTRGRRTEQVLAACLYIACREEGTPYLLIDFSDYLSINVYVLGAIFLQLCTLLRLQEHPIVQKPVDPSLFIHKFANGLTGGSNMQVSRTALRIIASMKRDWMQTGRKPSGLCGAALYISALSHGLKCSKSDIVNIVHICEATLTKRLIEFESTESGSLTIEEFNSKAEELEKDCSLKNQPNIGSNTSLISELLCEHKGGKIPHFAHGLCEACYNNFIEISGGLEGGSDPPAFQRAERERMAIASAEENAHQLQGQVNCVQSAEELNGSIATENSRFESAGPQTFGAFSDYGTSKESACNSLHGRNDKTAEAHEESESLSDIDDVEVDGYLHNEEEKHYKRIIWEEMNKEYLEEQAAKEAAAAAAKEAFEANFRNCPEDLRAAQELAAAAAAAVAKSRKERQQKRAAEVRSFTPAQTAAEATRQMISKKRLSSKINYDVLEKLFDETVAQENPKKSRTGSDAGNDKSVDIHKQGESVLDDEDGHENHSGGDYGNDIYDENVMEEYDYGNGEYDVY